VDILARPCSGFVKSVVTRQDVENFRGSVQFLPVNRGRSFPNDSISGAF
jgi:hypothetical protein